MNLRRWLTPGIGIKRWLAVVFAGLLLLAIAFAHFLRQITRDLAPDSAIGSLVDLLTLQFLPYELRGLIAATIGVALMDAGLLTREKRGVWSYYRLVPDVLDAVADALSTRAR